MPTDLLMQQTSERLILMVHHHVNYTTRHYKIIMIMIMTTIQKCLLPDHPSRQNLSPRVSTMSQDLQVQDHRRLSTSSPGKILWMFYLF